MVAVSSMHQALFKLAGVGASLAKPSTTLEFYNKAISALSNRIVTGASTSTTLMCCALFIALETLQGDSDAFVNHVRNGQNLIIQWRTKQGASFGTPQTTSAYNDDCLIEQHLMPFLAQQDAFANCFLNRDFGSEAVPEDKSFFKPVVHIPESFRSLEGARDVLMQLNEVIIMFSTLNYTAKYQGTFTFADVADLHRLQAKCRLWQATFENLRTRIAPLLQIDQMQAATSALLEIQFWAMDIYLATALTPEQSVFDPFFESFRRIVALAPLVIDTQINYGHDKNDHPTNNQWATALVPQLVLVAMLCRDPLIRRQGLDLLRRCVHRYAMWAKPVPPIIAATQRWIDIEESAIPRAPSPQSPSTPGDDDVELITRLPTEQARIHFSRLLDTPHADPRQKTAEFYLKPWGAYGSWFVRTEEIYI